jgi:hypothetical protein
MLHLAAGCASDHHPGARPRRRQPRNPPACLSVVGLRCHVNNQEPAGLRSVRSSEYLGPNCGMGSTWSWSSFHHPPIEEGLRSALRSAQSLGRRPADGPWLGRCVAQRRILIVDELWLARTTELASTAFSDVQNAAWSSRSNKMSGIALDRRPQSMKWDMVSGASAPIEDPIQTTPSRRSCSTSWREYPIAPRTSSVCSPWDGAERSENDSPNTRIGLPSVRN